MTLSPRSPTNGSRYRDTSLHLPAAPARCTHACPAHPSEFLTQSPQHACLTGAAESLREPVLDISALCFPCFRHLSNPPCGFLCSQPPSHALPHPLHSSLSTAPSS